jgi:DNA-binding phage protein
MALTRPFIETIRERAKRDPEFRAAMLAEAVECFAENDVSTAKALLRDYVNVTIGFQKLGKKMGKKPESLMRMLSAKGNPRADNLSQLISTLGKHEGVELHVEACS